VYAELGDEQTKQNTPKIIEVEPYPRYTRDREYLGRQFRPVYISSPGSGKERQPSYLPQARKRKRISTSLKVKDRESLNDHTL
jgi:hypothetical protein